MTSSKINYGGTAKVLDFSWYAPYKLTVDLLLGAFIWTMFLWRLYCHAPSIIHGLSTDVGHIAGIELFQSHDSAAESSESPVNTSVHDYFGEDGTLLGSATTTTTKIKDKNGGNRTYTETHYSGGMQKHYEKRSRK